MEDKDKLSTSDHLLIRSHIETLKAYDADVEEYHYAIDDMVDEENLLTQQAVLDDHNDRDSDYMVHLQYM